MTLKRWQIGVAIGALVAVLVGLGVGLWLRLAGGKFEFDDNLYGRAELIEIDAAGYDELLAEKASFGLLVYQPLCTTSYDFTQIVTAVTEAEQVSFYQIPFSQLKETALAEVVKYYPSFVLVREGEVVDALDAESDEDTAIYKEQTAFYDWLTDYVTLREGVGSGDSAWSGSDVGAGSGDSTGGGDSAGGSDSAGTGGESGRVAAALEDVTYDAEKVNVYFFWGNGCHICEREWEFWGSVETEYGDYFTLNAFEVWGNAENAELMQTFAAAMGDELKGVPYTVIGERTFKGFPEDFEAEMLEAIKEQYQDSFDIYFDELIGAIGQ